MTRDLPGPASGVSRPPRPARGLRVPPGGLPPPVVRSLVFGKNVE
ncbi:MAG: hypothetical protein OXU61_05420 [Gammaproteobacteria bacterium]|nr:hypothetical protein [Gammaproteobacteria bacterium]